MPPGKDMEWFFLQCVRALAFGFSITGSPAVAHCPFPVPPLAAQDFVFAAARMPRHIVFHFASRDEVIDHCSTFWDWRVACSEFRPGLVDLFPADVWIPRVGDGIDSECQRDIFTHEVIWHIAGRHLEEPPQ